MNDKIIVVMCIGYLAWALNWSPKAAVANSRRRISSSFTLRLEKNRSRDRQKPTESIDYIHYNKNDYQVSVLQAAVLKRIFFLVARLENVLHRLEHFCAL